MKMLTAAAIMVVVAMLSLTTVKSNELEVRKDLQTTFTTVTLDLTDEGTSGYQTFLTNLRNAVKAPTSVCGLPTTNGRPSKGQEYVHVKLMISKDPEQWVTLGINVMDLYVVGYTDNVEHQDPKDKKKTVYRSTFFKDTTEAAKKSLFEKTNIIRTTKFLSTYGSLEKFAKKNRVDINLKLKLLKEAINDVYGKPETELNNAKEATFVLVAVQIVAEAARFKFIEEAIVDVQTASTRVFKDKMVAFQNNWDSISKSIHDSKPPCDVLNPKQNLNNDNYIRFDDIKNDMAMLKFKRSKLETALSDADDVFVDDDQNLHLDA